jgi:undecaprenyl diphosphate synthase
MTANAAARIGGDQSPQRPPHPPDPSAPDVIEAVARLRRLVPAADPLARLPDVHPASIPAHVAMIMDGNGRWAQERGFPRIFGHRNGAAAVRAVVEECGRLGIGALTLFSFSSENWKRPADEVDALMRLCIEYLEGESRRLIEERIRFRVIGERSGLPAQVVGAIERLEAATRDLHGPTLCLAINYGGRAEIASAARRLARRAAQGSLDPACPTRICSSGPPASPA